MPEKYHLQTQAVPPRLPRIGKFGVVDWREDCAGCHNCVKKDCVYDRYRQEMQYIRDLNDANVLFFECMGCFSCVQNCTKGLLSLSVNPVFERMGDSYWTPDIILKTWSQAETAADPVSGGGYRGKFSGPGFDAMWTDMSEIVRPTRDGKHGREYISTAVDIGRKPPLLKFNGAKSCTLLPPLVDSPMPLVIDMLPKPYRRPQLLSVFSAVAERTGLISIIDSRDWELLGGEGEKYLANLAFYLDPSVPVPSKGILSKMRLVEISESDAVEKKIQALKEINPEIVVAIRVPLDSTGEERAIKLAHNPAVEVIHIVADLNGNQIEPVCGPVRGPVSGAENPKFIKDMTLGIQKSLVKSGIRDEITIIAGGGIALAEHMAKEIICGADLVTINLPLLIGLECRLCKSCQPGALCPARVDEISHSYGVGRMTNLISAWHDQLIEMMGAMGIRDVRRLRGETGRAMFFEDVEEETFGKLFGSRKKN